MIKIDGSYGEGGGQILRTALSLSAILGKPFEIYNIRKGRKKPGLLAQHLTSVRAAACLTQAKVDGDTFGSQNLKFIPNAIQSGNYEFNVGMERGSAGSCSLVAQSILPILFFAKKESVAQIKGGTHVPFSPIFDYLDEVLLPAIKRLGYDAESSIIKYGFYPTGGGEIVIRTKPFLAEGKNPLWQERGEFKSLKIVSRVCNLPLTIAERQMRRAREILKTFSPETVIGRVEADCPGTYIFIKADFANITAGFSSLGERGKPAERVAEEAAEEFLSYYETGGVFDSHLADQILIFLAVKGWKSTTGEIFSFTTSRITNHLLTNIEVIKRFIGIKIDLVGELGKRGEIRLTGFNSCSP